MFEVGPADVHIYKTRVWTIRLDAFNPTVCCFWWENDIFAGSQIR